MSRRRWCSEAASTLASQAVIQGGGIVTGIISARVLGPEGRGEFAAVVCLVGLCSAFAGLCSDQTACCTIGKAEADAPKVVLNGLVVSVISAVLAYGLMVFVAGTVVFRGNWDGLRCVIWFGLILPVIVVNNFYLGVDQGKRSFVAFNLYRALPVVLQYIAYMFVYICGYRSVQDFLAVTGLSTVVPLLLRVFVYGNHRACGRLESGLVRPYITVGLGFLAATTGSVLNMRIPFLLSVPFLSQSEVGMYSVALAVGGFTTFFSHVLTRIVFSHVVSLQGAEKLRAIARYVMLAMLLGGLAAICSLPLTEYILRIFFGAEFAPATTAARIAIIAFGLTGVSSVMEYSLKATGRPGYASRAYYSSLVLGSLVIISQKWIGSMGLTGMALCFAVSQLVCFVIMLHSVWRVLGGQGVSVALADANRVRMAGIAARKRLCKLL